ncbi:MAG: NifU family protein [Flavobacteriales bacterium]|jgi:Fe-S cluster biogenesis protein NfuA|nr:NifU family protein [Flavobacteriales bacterium]MCB0757303.1 NifU family protein [Flavobacteriales bacterium]
MSSTTLIDPEELERLKGRVNDALTELRPFLEADNGDITLESISEKGVVRVRLHGACSSCSMSAMTMKAGVEEAIKRVAPEVVRVEALK